MKTLPIVGCLSLMQALALNVATAEYAPPNYTTIVPEGTLGFAQGIVLDTAGNSFINDHAGIHSFTSTGVRRWGAFIGSVICTPTLAGGRLYVGSDNGRLYCLNPTTGTVLWSFLTAAKVRNTPLVDGSTVIFQANDGNAYWLNATNGIKRFSVVTGNLGPTPATGYYLGHPYHAAPWSSSPVLDHGKRIVIASSDGRVRAFDRVSGVKLGEVNLRTLLTNSTVQVEAPLAIAANGWTMVGTRRFGTTNPQQWVVAIDWTQSAGPWARWWQLISSDDSDPGSPGIIGGIVADRNHVYVSEYGHSLIKLDQKTGDVIGEWSIASLEGKLCATPLLLANGLLILLTSDAFPDPDVSWWKIYAIRTCDPGDSIYWSLRIPVENGLRDYLGCPAVDSSGRLHVVSSAGDQVRIETACLTYVGGWPRLQSTGYPLKQVVSKVPLTSVTDFAADGSVLGGQNGYAARWNGITQTTTILGAMAGQNPMGWFVGGKGTVWESGLSGPRITLPTPLGIVTQQVVVGMDNIIVGRGRDTAGLMKGLRWERDADNWLPSIINNPFETWVEGITPDGKIFGRANLVSPLYTTAFLSESPAIRLDDRLGISGYESAALGANGAGTVGYTYTGFGIRGFYKVRNTSRDLSTNLLAGIGGDSIAWDINCHGDIVGGGKRLWATDPWEALIWYAGLTNAYLVKASNWALTEAFGISDSGQVLARGYYNGESALSVARIDWVYNVTP